MATAKKKRVGGRPRGRFDPTINWELAKQLFLGGELLDNGETKWLSCSEIAARTGTTKQNLYGRMKREDWASQKDPASPLPPVPVPSSALGPATKGSGIDWELAKRLFIEGELVDGDPGMPRKVVHPSVIAIARRVNTSKQNLYTRLKREDWQGLKDKFQRVVDEGVTLARAESRVREIREPLQILDDYINLFDESIRNRKIRADAIADFDKAVRLRAFLRGEADARSEQKVVISLEAMQQKHRAMRELVTTFDDDVVGVVAQGEDEPPLLDEGDEGPAPAPEVGDEVEAEVAPAAASV